MRRVRFAFTAGLIPFFAATLLLCSAQPRAGATDTTARASTTARWVSDQPAPRPEPAQAAPRMNPEIRGDELMRTRNYVAAIDAYRSAPERSPVIWNKLGMAYHHMFALAEARKDYEKALQLDPRYANAMNNLGAVYYGERNYKRAEHYYKKAIKLEPTSATMYSNLGTAYFSQRRYKQGAQAYEKAFSLDPNVFDPDSPQNVEEASDLSARAIVNYSLAKMYAQAGKGDRALEYLRKALDEGFHDRKKLMEDKEFAGLRETPEFQQLLHK